MNAARRNLFIAAAAGAAALSIAIPLAPAIAGHENTIARADLSGIDEVTSGATNSRPAGDPNGSGEAWVFGIDGDPDTLCYVLTADRIETAQAAHIHEAAEGVNGPVVVPLAAPEDGDSADCVSESEAGAFPTGEQVEDILAHPENYYVNVHNATYPGGAIRGQLAAR